MNPLKAVGELVVAWASVVGTWVAYHIPETATLLLVTIPAGVWSWLRLIDYLRERKAR